MIFRFFVLFLLTFTVFSEKAGSQPLLHHDSLIIERLENRKDIFDIFNATFRKQKLSDSTDQNVEDFKDTLKSSIFSLLPNLNYSLVTNLAFGGMLSAYYYLDKEKRTNMSTTDLIGIYTLEDQLIFKLKSTIWPTENRYNFVGDWRFLRYPSYTYGLGPRTSGNRRVMVNYEYLRLYQNFFKEISGAFYMGIGYKLDYYYNIHLLTSEIPPETDLGNLLYEKETIASGPTFNFLYDSRENLMNPLGGRFYGYLNYRYNSPVFGSNNSWQSLLVDARKYIKVPASGKNILALWSYNWFTFGGEPAYLNLPSNGWDASDSQGRGYLQGRFRSSNLVSFETEYRFMITRNQVLGGVVFGNVQGVSAYRTFAFEKFFPAGGLGIRLKINKHTNTNLSLDFAVGVRGSRSVFINLGEVF